jgi:hypothetical protein
VYSFNRMPSGSQRFIDPRWNEESVPKEREGRCLVRHKRDGIGGLLICPSTPILAGQIGGRGRLFDPAPPVPLHSPVWTSIATRPATIPPKATPPLEKKYCKKIGTPAPREPALICPADDTETPL